MNLNLYLFSPPYRYDYVEVYNGGDEDSPMLGKFCGKIAPSPIISSGSQLLIKFVSDYETHGAGFSVRYEVFKTGVCPTVLHVTWLLVSNSSIRYKENSLK